MLLRLAAQTNTFGDPPASKTFAFVQNDQQPPETHFFLPLSSYFWCLAEKARKVASLQVFLVPVSQLFYDKLRNNSPVQHDNLAFTSFVFVKYWLLQVWKPVASIACLVFFLLHVFSKSEIVLFTCRRWENVTIDDCLLPSGPYHSSERLLVLPLCEVIVAVVEAAKPGGIDAALAICCCYVGVHQLRLHTVKLCMLCTCNCITICVYQLLCMHSTV